MSICHHADDTTILAYAAGTLEEGFSLLLAAHMESCQHCRSLLRDAEELGGHIINQVDSNAETEGGFDRLWDTLQSDNVMQFPALSKQGKGGAGYPEVLSPYLLGDLDSVSWERLVPGIKQFVLQEVESGNGSVRLLKIDPGVSIPKHSHNGQEMTLVLQGSYSDELGTFGVGDLSDLDQDIEHQPVVDSGGPCICLIATDERLRFSGVMNKVLQPFIGL